MKCFYHPDRDAVALCKSCNRGICPDCSADVPPGVACRSRCEADVAALNSVIERSKTAYQKAGAAHSRVAIGALLLGLLMIGFGVLQVLSRHYGASLYFVPFGCVFLFWSLLSYRSGRQIAGS